MLDSTVASENTNDLVPAARSAGYKRQFFIVTGTGNVEESATVLRVTQSERQLRARVVPFGILPRLCPFCQDRTIIGHGQRMPGTR